MLIKRISQENRNVKQLTFCVNHIIIKIYFV
nr:MAG TPA: hypothetical protein [Caudoviricetes sp.]